MMQNEKIDGGKGFDWGKTSKDYAKYRDIYPNEFYQHLIQKNLYTKGQCVLDIGTGTGVLPRNLYQYGATITGIDNSENQIEQAKELAKRNEMDITFLCTPAEEINLKEESFDTISACQCFTYFNHDILAPKISKLLKKDGRFVILYMAWLPYEDEIAGKSEELVLKYNPKWTGCGEERHDIHIPEEYNNYFQLEYKDIFDLQVPFNRESWNGRMKSCRGIGASLSANETAQFEEEHKQLLDKIAPEQFNILHYGAMTILKKK